MGIFVRDRTRQKIITRGAEQTFAFVAKCVYFFEKQGQSLLIFSILSFNRTDTKTS